MARTIGILGKITEIAKCRRGGMALLVALGLPVLVGGAGLGVDVTHWYMWKRELQYAADQAALAGAWARTDTDTQDTYVTRANQEFDANLDQLSDVASTPEVSLANFAGGTDNSVVVNASASRELPFTSLFIDTPPNITVYAQAVFQRGATYTSCLIAVDQEETGAITIGGNTVLTASCGLAALSTAEEAISVNGEPEIDAGWIIAAGGIDDWLKQNTDDTIMENMTGLYDPFEDLNPPSTAESQTPREYTCAAEPGYTTADFTETLVTSYTYYMGSSRAKAVETTYSGARPTTTSSTTVQDQKVATGTVSGSTTTETTAEWTTWQGGSGSNKIYERKITTATRSYSDVQVHVGANAGTVQPGTYEEIHVSCNTTFLPGIYVIDGGGLKITGQYEVAGIGVMFVLKNGAWIDIAGGANVNLTAMQTSELVSKGVPVADAQKLAGMLVFEDRDSEGTSKNKINGNANTLLNGTIYLPVSAIDFAGTAGVSSQCLMIAASTIKLTGNANMTTFCPPGSSNEVNVVNTQGTVKLVA